MRGLITTVGVLLASATMASAQFATNWVAFNDHNLSGLPAPTTGPNVTLYHLGGLTVMPGGGPGGPLTNHDTGQQLAASIWVTWTGGDGPDNFGASNDPDAGTPAYNLFNGIVDVGGSGVGTDEGIIGLRSSEMNVVTMTFSNLDTSQRYLFRGTSVRGNNYNDRWAQYEIHAVSATDAHVNGSANMNIFTADTFGAAGLTAGQVVLNSGENRAGSLVGWNDIVPFPDGTFSITEQQFIGTAPFGTPSAGPYAYGMNAIMLAEIFTGPPSAPLIVAQPVGVTNEEQQVAIVRVIATGTPPLTYQWFRGTPPGGTAIPGATRATFSVTNTAGSGKAWSVPGDSGDYYAVVNGALNPPATTTAAKVLVHADTTPPVFLYATCDPVDLHIFTLTLSEAVDDSGNQVTDGFNWSITAVGGGSDPVLGTIGYTPGSTTITFTNATERDPTKGYMINYLNTQPTLTDLSIAQNAMPPNSSILANCIATEVLALNANWRYEDNDVDPGPTWFSTGFADSGWALGPGVFDAKRDAAGAAGQNCRDMTLYNLGTVGTCIKLTSPVTMTNLITAYFRTHFFFGGDPTTAILDANGKFDDGAVVYLNGTELTRVGVPPAPTVIGHNTFASRGVGDGDAQDTERFLFPAALRNGDNVLAVSLHEQALTSSDLTMGLRIVALTRAPLSSAGPTMTITREGANVRIKWAPASGTLQYTDTLTGASTWTDQTTGQVGPGEYLIPRNQVRRFYSLRQ